MAHFAADRPLARHRASRFNYSSGTSNIISGIVARTVGPGRELRPLPAQPALRPARHDERRPRVRRRRHLGRLVLPAGHARATTPASGCSTCATACGTASGSSRPAGWTTAAPWCRSTTPRTPAPTAPTGGRARPTLDTRPSGTFRASGYEGQSITICPALDLIVVRLGKTPHEREPNLVPWRAAMVQAFADADAGSRRGAGRSGALGRGDEDGDLPVRLLLVLGVGRVRRHGRAPTRWPSRRR